MSERSSENGLDPGLAPWLVLAAALGVPLVGGALEPEELAVGWALELPAEGSVFEVALTREIYENATSLEQVAIFDADGVPASFYLVAPSPGAVEQRTRLAASPLYAAASDTMAADVAVSSGRDETRVRVVPPGEAAETVTGFLIDAREVDWAPAAIELEWRNLERPFLINVVVERSVDLIGWRVVGRGSVAALSIGGVETRHARVAVRAEPGGYYRIGASRAVPGWMLEGVTLTGATADPAATRTAVIEAMENVSGDEMVFDLGGPLPVRTVTLDFGERSGWIAASLASGPSREGPWRVREASRLFYDVSFEGRTFVSAPVTLGSVRDRFYKLTPDNGSRVAQAALEVEYAEERLRFAAEGRRPYMLGAGTRSPEAGPDPTFEAVWRRLAPVEDAVRPAQLGAMRVLGGAAAAEPERTTPWRTFALWAALAAGVLGVAVMALRLGTEMLARVDRG